MQMRYRSFMPHSTADLLNILSTRFSSVIDNDEEIKIKSQQFCDTLKQDGVQTSSSASTQSFTLTSALYSQPTHYLDEQQNKIITQINKKISQDISISETKGVVNFILKEILDKTLGIPGVVIDTMNNSIDLVANLKDTPQQKIGITLNENSLVNDLLSNAKHLSANISHKSPALFHVCELIKKNPTQYEFEQYCTSEKIKKMILEILTVNNSVEKIEVPAKSQQDDIVDKCVACASDVVGAVTKYSTGISAVKAVGVGVGIGASTVSGVAIVAVLALFAYGTYHAYQHYTSNTL